MIYNDERYRRLNRTGESLTPDEFRDGWHYCPDWDWMLIGPSMPAEFEACTCGVTKPEPKT